MSLPPILEHVGLLLLGGLVLVGAIFVVTLGNLFRAALCLGVVLLGIAGLFVALQADFLAFVQILVYVGAILTMVIFAIMLTAKLQRPPAAVASRQRLPAALVCLGLFVLMTTMTQVMAPSLTPARDVVPLDRLGAELITNLLLPFEIISLVFVVAIVGSVVLASAESQKRRPEGVRQEHG